LTHLLHDADAKLRPVMSWRSNSPNPVIPSAINPYMRGAGLARTYYYSAPLRFVWNFVLPALTLFQKNVNRPATSGRRLAALASGKMGDLTGKYISMGKVFPCSPLSQDRAKARELWDASAEMLGLPATLMDRTNGH